MKFLIEVDLDQLGESSIDRVMWLLKDGISSDSVIAEPVEKTTIRAMINGTPIRIGCFEIVE